MNEQLRIAAVINPAAGGDGEHALAVLEGIGTAAVEVLATAAPGDATDIACKLATSTSPPDIIVGIGGDGTISQVAAGLYRAGESGTAVVPPLLAAPGGTGNSSYRGLWDDQSWVAVAGLALRGQAVTRLIDLARIRHNDEIVLLGSGSGLFAATLLATRGRPETGRELLMAAALAAMQDFVPWPGRVTVDGVVRYEGDIIETITGGFGHRGGLLRLVPDTIVDDGLQDITIVTGAADMSAFAQAALAGHVYDVPGILSGRGSQVTVARLDGQPVLFEHDGEVMPQDVPSYDIGVLPAALKVLTAADAPPWFGAR